MCAHVPTEHEGTGQTAGASPLMWVSNVGEAEVGFHEVTSRCEQLVIHTGVNMLVSILSAENCANISRYTQGTHEQVYTQLTCADMPQIYDYMSQHVGRHTMHE